MIQIYVPKTNEQHRVETQKIITQLIAQVNNRYRSIPLSDTYIGDKHPDRTDRDGEVIDKLLGWKASLC